MLAAHTADPSPELTPQQGKKHHAPELPAQQLTRRQSAKRASAARGNPARSFTAEQATGGRGGPWLGGTIIGGHLAEGDRHGNSLKLGKSPEGKHQTTIAPRGKHNWVTFGKLSTEAGHWIVGGLLGHPHKSADAGPSLARRPRWER